MLVRPRFETKQYDDGSWLVIDTSNGNVARFEGSLANDFMDRDEAEEIAIKLNFECVTNSGATVAAPPYFYTA